MTLLLLLVVLLVLGGLGTVISYNRFVLQRALIAESWRQVDVELRRRHDLAASGSPPHPETEDRIAAARRFYNANVRAYNSRLARWPSGLIGRTFRFAPADYISENDPAVRGLPSSQQTALP
jgi:hypothetical protein